MYILPNSLLFWASFVQFYIHLEFESLLVFSVCFFASNNTGDKKIY